MPMLRPTLLLLTAAFTASHASSAPPTFAARLTLQGDGVIFTTGDFNNDGNEDIIGVIPVPGSPTNDFGISVQLGNGNGAFVPGFHNDLGPNFVPAAIAAADFNGDGLLDVVVLSPSTNALYVVLQRYGKHPVITPIEILNASGAINIGIADVNGDGRPDLVIPGSSSTQLLLNVGRGNFSPATVVTTLPGSFVVLADINKDGNTDLVLSPGACCIAPVAILLGDGQGRFSFNTNAQLSLFGVASQISVADFDGDGSLDIAATSGNAAQIAFGNGDGSFGPSVHSILPAPYNQGIAVASGDLNGDGRPDLFVLASGSSGTAILLFLNGNLGVFTSTAIYPVQGAAASMQVAPIVSGAGNAGLVLAPAPQSQLISVYVSNGLGALENGLLVGPNAPATGLITADFNGDGRPDIATLSSQGLSILVNTGPAAGLFKNVTTLPFSSGVLLAGDFTRDGRIDLVNINGSSGQLLVGEGTGQFRLKVPPFNAGVPAAAAIAADMNGDGSLDIVTSAPAVILGTGNGTFLAPLVASGNCVSSVLAVADFNLDGKLDVLSTCNNTIDIFLGNGDGTLGSPVAVLQNLNGIASLATGDFNHDGFTDFAFTTNSFGAAIATAVFIELGNGDGTFQQSGPYLAPAQGLATPFSLTAGYFNSDQNLDLAVLNAGDPRVSVFAGKGDGTFAAPVLYATAANPACIAAAPLQYPALSPREDLLFCSAQGVSIDLNTTKK